MNTRKALAELQQVLFLYPFSEGGVMFEQIRTMTNTISGFLSGERKKRLRHIGSVLIVIGVLLMLLSAVIKT